MCLEFDCTTHFRCHFGNNTRNKDVWTEKPMDGITGGFAQSLLRSLVSVKVTLIDSIKVMEEPTGIAELKISSMTTVVKSVTMAVVNKIMLNTFREI